MGEVIKEQFQTSLWLLGSSRRPVKAKERPETHVTNLSREMWVLKK